MTAANVDALRGIPLGRQAIADLERHFADDAHATPEQVADFRRRLDTYATSGNPQAEFNLEPPACA